MSFKKLKFQIHHLSSTSSTNIHALCFAKQKSPIEGTVFFAQHQSKGRGQLDTEWHSEEGSNLIFSVLLCPSLRVDQQFLLAQSIALGIYQYVDNLSVGTVNIKWPNDTLVDGKKIAGTLIQNVLSGNQIQYSIVGIGLNVNQTTFPDFSRPATSLQLLNGKKFNLEIELQAILEAIKHTYTHLQAQKYERIQEAYLQKLYGKHKAVRFEDRDGTFQGNITKILPSGKLVVNRNGKLCAYDMKAIKFID